MRLQTGTEWDGNYKTKHKKKGWTTNDKLPIGPIQPIQCKQTKIKREYVN
jgi:hypothetical protein